MLYESVFIQHQRISWMSGVPRIDFIGVDFMSKNLWSPNTRSISLRYRINSARNAYSIEEMAM